MIPSRYFRSISFFFLLPFFVSCSIKSFGGNMLPMIKEIKKTIVFIGSDKGNGQFSIEATGFFIEVEKVFHLATAKHVVFDFESKKISDSNKLILYNRKDGQIGVKGIQAVKNQFHVEWMFHPNPEVDVAILPFPIDLSTDDVKVIQKDLFFDANQLDELLDIFFLSFQPGVILTKSVNPIFRGGIISRINDDKTMYIDGAAFPGNSGSPVFFKPTAIHFSTSGIEIGNDSLGGKFIGIIGEYVPYQEIAISQQTKRPRVIFEENTGLSKVWSTKFLDEIVESKPFKDQVGEIQKKLIREKK